MSRSSRVGLRTTPQQDAVLRRAAKVAHKSLTEFILDSAYRVAEQTLLDQRLFLLACIIGRRYDDSISASLTTAEIPTLDVENPRAIYLTFN